MESDIHGSASRLLRAANREPLTQSRVVAERVLNWATSDPEFRVKLLRFVDVLPTLRSAGAVADHIRQYFRGDVPALVHAGSELAAQPVFRPVVSQVVRSSVYAMAHRFIAGDPGRLCRACVSASDGAAYTVDLWAKRRSRGRAEVYTPLHELIECWRESAGPARRPLAGRSASQRLDQAHGSQFEAAAPDGQPACASCGRCAC
jgi:hypothetical protein